MSGDSSGASLSGQLILIVILTLLNAFFAAGEMAIVSVNKTSVETKAKGDDRRAKKILQLINDPNKFLSTIQVAITLAGFLSSASAATTLSTRLESVLGQFPGSREISIVVITVILSFITLVLGELYPKRIALQRPYEVAKFTQPMIGLFGKILSPFIWLLDATINLLMKITPIDFNKKDEPITRNEMIATLRQSRNNGTINSDEYQMLQGIIRFGDKTAREIMVPRTDDFMIDINNPVDENIDDILNQPYSRIPVYGSDKDNIIGIIHIKDLLKKSREVGFNNINFKSIMKEPLFVQEGTNIDTLLLRMRSTQTQIAMVVDEYGGIIGLATIEDILEEIVGEIDDEYDPVTKNFQRLGPNKFSVVGKMTIEDFDELFEEEIKVEDVDTIAGYLIMGIGEIPDAKHPKSITLKDGVIITSGELNGSRIENVIVTVPDVKLKNVTTNMFKGKY
ncbi:hemolysin family protein [Companilactobacillus halodurans]|uniref:HlyC/CorC family transporter n=1 Tax=Companilactobacillus halodurans TaxID=2584183 RepID=A0A5P0ZQW3_9LACO|nr:hemolysin family protein [Companilactobacillus halodurans]MQS76586.1 HlyC/CorC family transporter [Companilactobacillus halodurans]MQS98210.1 HlyC/CorC family transporter [Companilactobacillus halodurans]